MRCTLTLLLALLALPLSAQSYYPPRGSWAEASPQALMVDTQKLTAAVNYAITSENTASKDQAIVQATTFGAREPYDQIIGPMGVRAAANGLIVYKGKLICKYPEILNSMNPSRPMIRISVKKTLFFIFWRASLPFPVHLLKIVKIKTMKTCMR